MRQPRYSTSLCKNPLHSFGDEGLGTITVRSRGRITIPAHLRKKYGFTENTSVEILEEDGKIIIRKPFIILDLAGTGKGDPEELKRQLDRMRETDRQSGL